MDIVIITIITVVWSLIVTFCICYFTIGRMVKKECAITGIDTSMHRDSTVLYLGHNGGLRGALARDLTEEEKRVIMEYNLMMQQNEVDFQQNMQKLELELQAYAEQARENKECTNSDAN